MRNYRSFLIFINILISYNSLAVTPTSTKILTINTLAQSFSPKYYWEDNQMKGYSIDIIKALEEIDPLLKFSDQHIFASIPRIEMDLESGKIDAFIGVFKTIERNERFQFIDIPLHEFTFQIAVRANDPIIIKSLEDIKKIPDDNIILTLLGTKLFHFLKEKKGLNIDAGAINFSSNVEKLIKGRGRFLLATDISFYKLANKKEIRILPIVFNREAQYIILSKKISNEKKVHLTNALKKLNETGKLKAIFQHYSHIN